MKFRSYVPAAVKDYVTEVIEGLDGEQGLAAALETAEKALVDLDTAINMRLSLKTEVPNNLRLQRAELTNDRVTLANDISCLQRLVEQSDMEAVYTRLGDEGLRDEQWRTFVHAAWTAHASFSQHREKLK